eukprot:TRINITY_DN7094_c0_g1_i4.p3 TRINITY_DN7094_c0_g1~~TRINITY_DN7094_c0_g1_i4.p3  ORF type:complete len:114 (+),score=8.39 TRINITY_DN7094_c0_g1_i4:374-715(+)
MVEDVAFHKIPSLMKLLKQEDCTALQNISDDPPYCSTTSIHELVKCISEVYQGNLFDSIRDSDYVSILLDESTDNTGDRGTMVYLKYFKKNNNVKTTFCAYLPNINFTAKRNI